MGKNPEFWKRERVGKEYLHRLENDHLKERCAVFGVYTLSQPAAPLIHIGLSALQHRGQETSGITTIAGAFYTKKGDGLVSQLFSQSDIQNLHGHIGIGHNRYATVGGLDDHAQPVTTENGLVALSHNGTLPQTHQLESFLKSRDIITEGLNDSEMMQRSLEYYVRQGIPVEEAVAKVYSLFTGAFSLTIATKDTLIGVKDRFGIRPLALGSIGSDGFVLSSETCGIDAIGGKFIREVNAGEMVIIDSQGLRSKQLANGEDKLDIFEVVYFARPDSILYGKRVNDMRREMGRQLARERKIDADIVIAVPNSAIPAAAGYAQESGIPYEADALIKDSYTHRTFINPSPSERITRIRRKFTPIPTTLSGKRVVVIDDSIVRGPTSKELVTMLKESGASEVHFISASPPVKYPDFYGIATPTQEELIASHLSTDQICEYIGADSLQYLSYEGLIKATGIPEEKFNTSCFTGRYPIDIGEHARRINFSV